MRRRISAAANSRPAHAKSVSWGRASSPSEPHSSGGFTLIESLIALAILGVIVGVLVRVHLQTLRAEEFSRLRGQAVLESETILTGSMLGNEPQSQIEEAQKQGWKVATTRVGEPGAPAFTEWRVSVSNPSAPVVVLMLREQAATGKTNGPERAKGD